jgi:hypothetical protein
MPSLLFIDTPIRSPRWRYLRVLEMLGHRPLPLRPTRFDDHEIRVLRRVLLMLMAARHDEAQREQVFEERPAVCQAFQLFYTTNTLARQILESRLLTDESFQELAVRYNTETPTIEYFAKLFFDVRPRLERGMSLHHVVRGEFNPYCPSTRTIDEGRGYALRMIAAYGGRIALDALVSSLSGNPHLEGSNDGSDETLQGTIQAVVALVTSPLRPPRDAVPLMKLAQKYRRAEAASDKARNHNWDEALAAALAAMQVPTGEKTDLLRNDAVGAAAP